MTEKGPEKHREIRLAFNRFAGLESIGPSRGIFQVPESDFTERTLLSSQIAGGGGQVAERETET
jgi:hypothetical protein